MAAVARFNTAFQRRMALAFALAGSALGVAAPAQVQAEAVLAAPAALATLPGAWSQDAARDLIAAIESAGEEGLDPSAYDADAVRRAMKANDPAALDAAADPVALALARDYFSGRIADKAALDWHIERSPYDAARLPAELRGALTEGRLQRWLRDLLPQNEQYQALRTALTETSDGAERDRIRANMERWRWMPRTLGKDYLYVNVPSYELKVVADGAAISTYSVVVGSPKTPTPQLALTASSVVVNPWWNVPESIAKQGLGRGYQAVRTADGGVRYRQPPGPRNSLGKVKIDMPNAHAIYLHDTPSKALFAKDNRALSHGCIRVQDIDQLAVELMRQDDNKERFEAAYAAQDTATLALQDRWPVYLVYFTVEADGGRVKMLADPYGRDALLTAKLDETVRLARRTTPVRLAAR